MVRRAAATVGVGVEADQDVRQAHRAEEQREDQRVRRRTAGGCARPPRTAAPTTSRPRWPTPGWHGGPPCPRPGGRPCPRPSVTESPSASVTGPVDRSTVGRAADVERGRCRCRSPSPCASAWSVTAARAVGRPWAAGSGAPSAAHAASRKTHRHGDRRQLEPVLEGLHERDGAHAAGQHVARRRRRRPGSRRPPAGAPVTVRRASPAPCSCGSR